MISRAAQLRLLTVAFWVLFGGISGLQIQISMLAHHHSWAALIGYQILVWSVWIAYSFAIGALVRRVPFVPARLALDFEVALEHRGLLRERDARPSVPGQEPFVRPALARRRQTADRRYRGPEVHLYGRREFAFRDPDGHLVIISEVTKDPPTTREEQGGDGVGATSPHEEEAASSRRG